MRREAAVSPVVGETLMIALVLILVPLVTISLMNQLPEDRIPTVTIRMGPLTGDSVIFYHKGGDWIKPGTMKILVNGQDHAYHYTSPIFDLGNHFFITGVKKGDAISLVVKNAVIFSGEVHE